MDEVGVCAICGGKEDSNDFLCCNNGCGNEVHMYCLSFVQRPANLTEVDPLWNCPACDVRGTCHTFGVDSYIKEHEQLKSNLVSDYEFFLAMKQQSFFSLSDWIPNNGKNHFKLFDSEFDSSSESIIGWVVKLYLPKDCILPGRIVDRRISEEGRWEHLVTFKNREPMPPQHNVDQSLIRDPVEIKNVYNLWLCLDEHACEILGELFFFHFPSPQIYMRPAQKVLRSGIMLAKIAGDQLDSNPIQSKNIILRASDGSCDCFNHVCFQYFDPLRSNKMISEEDLRSNPYHRFSNCEIKELQKEFFNKNFEKQHRAKSCTDKGKNENTNSELSKVLVEIALAFSEIEEQQAVKHRSLSKEIGGIITTEDCIDREFLMLECGQSVTALDGAEFSKHLFSPSKYKNMNTSETSLTTQSFVGAISQLLEDHMKESCKNDRLRTKDEDNRTNMSNFRRSSRLQKLETPEIQVDVEISSRSKKLSLTLGTRISRQYANSILDKVVTFTQLPGIGLLSIFRTGFSQIGRVLSCNETCFKIRTINGIIPAIPESLNILDISSIDYKQFVEFEQWLVDSDDDDDCYNINDGDIDKNYHAISLIDKNETVDVNIQHDISNDTFGAVSTSQNFRIDESLVNEAEEFRYQNQNAIFNDVANNDMLSCSQSHGSSSSTSDPEEGKYIFSLTFEDEGTIGKFGYLKEKKVCYIRSVESRYSGILQENDEVIEVNGINYVGEKLRETEKAMRNAKSCRPFTLTFRRPQQSCFKTPFVRDVNEMACRSERIKNSSAKIDSREIAAVDEERTLSLQDDDLRNICHDNTLKLKAGNTHHQEYVEKLNENMHAQMQKTDTKALIYLERDIKEIKDYEKFSESQKSYLESGKIGSNKVNVKAVDSQRKYLLKSVYSEQDSEYSMDYSYTRRPTYSERIGGDRYSSDEKYESYHIIDADVDKKRQLPDKFRIGDHINGGTNHVNRERDNYRSRNDTLRHSLRHSQYFECKSTNSERMKDLNSKLHINHRNDHRGEKETTGRISHEAEKGSGSSISKWSKWADDVSKDKSYSTKRNPHTTYPATQPVRESDCHNKLKRQRDEDDDFFLMDYTRNSQEGASSNQRRDITRKCMKDVSARKQKNESFQSKWYDASNEKSRNNYIGGFRWKDSFDRSEVHDKDLKTSNVDREPRNELKASETCRNFLKGICNRGDSCHYKHGRINPSNFNRVDSSSMTIAIINDRSLVALDDMKNPIDTQLKSNRFH